MAASPLHLQILARCTSKESSLSVSFSEKYPQGTSLKAANQRWRVSAGAKRCRRRTSIRLSPRQCAAPPPDNSSQSSGPPSLNGAFSAASRPCMGSPPTLPVYYSSARRNASSPRLADRVSSPREDDGNGTAVKLGESDGQLANNDDAGADPLGIPLPQPLSLLNEHLSSTPESSLRVAYQGVPGAYSEAAAGKAYPDCVPVPCDQFDSAFQAVQLWLVDRAVLPIENSLGGSIHRNYDLLLSHRLHIVGEVQLAVRHCLLGLPGTKISNLKRVMSHPQALAQCDASMGKLGVTRVAVSDTAGAAQMVALEGNPEAGAIASARAADIYGLEILQSDFQDDPDNITRFLILAREPIIPGVGKPWKTSIVFSLEVGPGVLFKALSVFALRGINLTKIESRPQKGNPVGEPGLLTNGKEPALKDLSPKTKELVSHAREEGYHLFNYLFYVDFQASMAESSAQNALRHLQEFATFMRVLGSYPMDVSPIAKL
eukprot:TRINITY_DN6737_c0_g4_i1.p1 TRINITY_DN6737_c0_g4~~TRINITY_DN6737_c0_g4_i1.p1  ORF type:complete len:488 (-),score=63.03 TRINITY_DN6737_c0_g4_i1:1538-3001(-)